MVRALEEAGESVAVAMELGGPLDESRFQAALRCRIRILLLRRCIGNQLRIGEHVAGAWSMWSSDRSWQSFSDNFR